MNKQFLSFLIICGVICLGIKVTAQTARCDYQYDYFWTTGYKNTNASYYKCDLSTAQTNHNEKLTGIAGQHETRLSDVNVNYIANYLNNRLKTFSSIFCQKFPNLEVISIKNAEPESIDENSLSNCKNLNYLLLHGNKFREIPEKFLNANAGLTYLRFTSNQLTTLPENLFRSQRALEDLGIDQNQIIFLPSNIFRPLVNLGALYMFENRLQSLNPRWFESLQNLKLLQLEKNQITEIPSKCFENLKKLEKLYIYKNKIKTLHSDSFNGLQNLQLFSMYGNEIADLPVDAFAQLKSLKYLYLSDNKLTTIHSDSFGIQNQLTTVALDDNKIDSIDVRFIDNTAVANINMKNNICSQLLIESRAELKPNLKKCFGNYRSRSAKVFKCGEGLKFSSRIIGGNQISKGDFPWIAALMLPQDKYFCGGILVSSRKVVTAAHCMNPKRTRDVLSASDFTVALGTHDLTKTAEVGRVNYNIDTINVHPDWNTLTQSFDADIAVLVLENEVIFNQHIHPICLPSLNIATISAGVVIGFGKSEDRTKEHENIPKIIGTPIHDNYDCFAVNDDLAALSSGRTFCGGSGKGYGVCNGDSGGGLIVNYGGAYYLRGIVSASLLNAKRECDVDTYAVFTDVLKFVDWINGIPTDWFSRHNK